MNSTVQLPFLTSGNFQICSYRFYIKDGNPVTGPKGLCKIGALAESGVIRGKESQQIFFGLGTKTESTKFGNFISFLKLIT